MGRSWWPFWSYWSFSSPSLPPRERKKAVSAETQYTTVSPENRDITNVYSASGTLSAANSYTVKATVKGDVLTADFEVGDVVEKGAVLYTIDSSDVVSGVEKAELNLGQAQRSYDDAVDASTSAPTLPAPSLPLKCG